MVGMFLPGLDTPQEVQALNGLANTALPAAVSTQNHKAMTTKTFKIGEYCRGGIITVEITGKVIVVIGKEWDFSAGSTRSSNQSKAKEFTRGTVSTDEPDAYNKLYNFLIELTTHFYTEQVIKWINTKVVIKAHSIW